MPELPIDCLREIIELVDDRYSLYTCLFVNRLWCELSARILWRYQAYHSLWRCPKVLITLVSCLPKDSKEYLLKNKITIPPQTPSFNYASFCRVLSVDIIDDMIHHTFGRHPNIYSTNINNKHLIWQELFKSYMNNIPSLRVLKNLSQASNVNFINYHGAKDCLRHLSVLKCGSEVNSEFFLQMSKFCNNIQSISLKFEFEISNGLSEFISSQKNLKSISIINNVNWSNWKVILPSLSKHADTLTEMKIKGYGFYGSLAFIATFTKLHKIFISSCGFDDLKDLRQVTFPHLKILKIPGIYPNLENLGYFLEINGKNLIEFDIGAFHILPELDLAKLCPNLKIYSMVDDVDDMRIIFKSCQQLESITVRVYELLLISEKEILEIVVSNSPKEFYELKLYYADVIESKLTPEDLETFFVSWSHRRPLKPLSFIISYNEFYLTSLDANDEHME
ncbi:10357_t:CDS:1, partial [Funneliformis caledonium]